MPIEHPRHPFKLLRHHLRSHPLLRESSTQKGFAALIDRSESLVRSVEIGRIKMSPKLAQHIENTIGVASTWLSSRHYAKDPIISTNGKPLTHDMVLACLKRASEANMREAEENSTPTQNAPANAPLTLAQQMAAGTLKLVEQALAMSLARDDPSLMHEITELLLRYETRHSPRTYGA